MLRSSRAARLAESVLGSADLFGGIFGKLGIATPPFLGGGIPGLGGTTPTGTPTNPIYVAPASGAGGIGGTPSFLGPIGDLPFPGFGSTSGAAGGGNFGSIFSGNNQYGSAAFGALSTAGGIGGGLLLGVGARQGGHLGALEGAAGGAIEGALSGLAFGPIGAAVGAVIGGIGGALAGALGGPSFQQRVATQAWKQSYYAPPSETFSFASNGSIGQTLGTGFAQSGNQFSQFGLPANTPFWANAITGPLGWRQLQLLQEEQANAGGNQPFGGFNASPFAGQGPLGTKAGPAPSVTIHVHAIDSKGVGEFFNEHGDAISGILSSKSVYSSSSRFGASVRQAAFLP